MTIEIKWTDTDPETGQRRFLSAEKWAGEWSFKWKRQRRGNGTKGLETTRAMWEHVVESPRPPYQRPVDVFAEIRRQAEQVRLVADVLQVGPAGQVQRHPAAAQALQ